MEHSVSDSGLDFPKQYEVVPVLRNESVNSSTLRLLGDQEISAAVEALLNVDSLLAPLHRKVVDYITLSRDCDLLAGLAAHTSQDVRCAVASNRYLPEELVWKLIEDKSINVRASLADNHFLPAFLLETLAEDEDDRVAQRANRSLDKQSAAASCASLSSRLFHWMHLTLPAAKQPG